MNKFGKKGFLLLALLLVVWKPRVCFFFFGCFFYKLSKEVVPSPYQGLSLMCVLILWFISYISGFSQIWAYQMKCLRENYNKKRILIPFKHFK